MIQLLSQNILIPLRAIRPMQFARVASALAS